MFGNACSVYCSLANLLSLMTIIWVSLVSQFLLGFFFTCSRREPLGLCGRDFLWAGYPPYHQINSAEALKETQALTPTTAWRHPFFIYH